MRGVAPTSPAIEQDGWGRITGVLLAFASGTLISVLAFELLAEAVPIVDVGAGGGVMPLRLGRSARC